MPNTFRTMFLLALCTAAFVLGIVRLAQASYPLAMIDLLVALITAIFLRIFRNA